MTFLYFAHIPFVLLFLAFTVAFVCFNWRNKPGTNRTATDRKRFFKPAANRAATDGERFFKPRP